MANRIAQCFEKLKKENKTGLVAYITAGDPQLTATGNLIECFEQAGVDILELGVPFSDPLADGLVNQLAAQRGLEAGTTLEGILQTVKKARKTCSIPIVLFTYLNPVDRYGIERLCHDAAEAGVDGVLILDLPPEEISPEIENYFTQNNLARIVLVTPAERIKMITQTASGFVYYISREGVTGMQSSVATAVPERIALLRSITPLPIVVGFGVANPEHVKEIAQYSDGVVVGSAIVDRIGKLGDSPSMPEEVTRFVKTLVAAAKAG